MMIDSLEVLGSTLAANDVVVAAFTTAQLSADDAPVCSEDLRSKFPDLQFGIASGVRSRDFAPVIPIIHEGGRPCDHHVTCPLTAVPAEPCCAQGF
jgi:hypothetical protein